MVLNAGLIKVDLKILASWILNAFMKGKNWNKNAGPHIMKYANCNKNGRKQ